jgi:predicted DCC family thiol-disulfide oxidoreductase YuxK
MIDDEGRSRHLRTGDPQRWVVLYDGECGLCKWLLAALLRWDRGLRLRPVGLQRAEADELLAELVPEQRIATWHLVSPAGERHSGGSALPVVLRALPGGRIPAAATARFPALTDHAYTWVAAHRTQLARWVPAASKQRASETVLERERALGR